MGKTNKLSIYKMKTTIEAEQYIKDNYKKNVLNVNDGLFYYDFSFVRTPSWIENFFNNQIDVADKLKVSNAKAVFLIPIQDSGEEIWFAICFGTGRHMLNPLAYEERFGLLVTINSINPESIRSIEKTNLGPISKMSKEQLSRASTVGDFGIDIEQDLVKAITGNSTVDSLGNIISGMESLHIAVKVDIDNIKKLLSVCTKQFVSKEYLKHFDWIDQISEVKNREKISALDQMIIERIRLKKYEEIWMAIPEIINWEDISGFSYIKKQNEVHDDLYIEHFFNYIEKEIIDIKELQHKYIFMHSASQDSIVAEWNSYTCLYTEVIEEENTYILNNGKWYLIEKNFVDTVNSAYDKIRLSTIELPDNNHDNEDEYNKYVAASNSNYYLMDKKTIQHGGAKNKIEFCDIFTRENQLIHVKKYGGSSVLSHLFFQGLNSGEYFHSDSDFRKKLNKQLPVGWKIPNPNSKIKSSNYEIIFAIISNNDAERPHIPFFSKVSLKNAKRRLESLNYNVTLKRIKHLKEK